MRRATVALLGALLLGLALAGCGGSSPQPTASGSATVPTGTATASSAAKSPTKSPNTLDVAFTGALQGHWRTGDAGTSANCASFGTNQVQINLTGPLNNAAYGLIVAQDSFAAGTYTFPTAGTLAGLPTAQISTSANSRAQWDLRGNAGSGTLTLAGSPSNTLSGSIEADLADFLGSSAVHVSGSFSCQTGS